MLCTLRVPVLLFTQTFRMFSWDETLWLIVYAVVVENLNIFDVGERLPCVVRRLITCPFNTPLSIGGIRDPTIWSKTYSSVYFTAIFIGTTYVGL